MARNVNSETLDLIKRWEGCELTAYADVGGVLTIGYGSTVGVEPGMKITKAEAERRLKRDLDGAETAVDNLVKVKLTENQFGALVSFVFNVGSGAFKASTLLKKLNAGDYAAVPAELTRWSKARVNGRMVTVAGLANRRAAEAGLWSRGERVASNTVEAKPARAPMGKADTAAGAGTLGSVSTIANTLGEHADTIQQVSWLLTGKGIIMIAAGIVLAGCLGYLAYSWWKRSKG
jgi:lysozyme